MESEFGVLGELGEEVELVLGLFFFNFEFEHPVSFC